MMYAAKLGKSPFFLLKLSNSAAAQKSPSRIPATANPSPSPSWSAWTAQIQQEKEENTPDPRVKRKTIYIQKIQK